jgi:hypothetical protein
LIDLLSDPEDGESTFPRKVDELPDKIFIPEDGSIRASPV